MSRSAAVGLLFLFFFFFFQAEDGIRDHCVTGVQTCALPISLPDGAPTEPRVRITRLEHSPTSPSPAPRIRAAREREIGRASCRKGVGVGGRRIIKKKKKDRNSVAKDTK